MKVLLILCLFFSTIFAQEEIRFGIFPHLSNSRMQKLFSPLKLKLSSELDIKVSMGTAANFDLFTKELQEERYDLVFIQPFDYPWLHDRHGYIPLARRNTILKAIFIVNKKEEYHSLDDLKGKKVGIISEKAAVTRMIRYSLKEKGVNLDKDFEIVHAKNHFTCMQMVLVNKVTSCVTANRAKSWFEFQKKREPFKTVYQTKGISHTLFVIHPRVSKERRNKIEKVLLKWDDRPKHIKKLHPNTKGFVIAKDLDYDEVRKMIE